MNEFAASVYVSIFNFLMKLCAMEVSSLRKVKVTRPAIATVMTLTGAAIVNITSMYLSCKLSKKHMHTEYLHAIENAFSPFKLVNVYPM